MRKVLLVDDQAIEARMLIGKIAEAKIPGEQPVVFWVPSIFAGIELLLVNIHKFDIVIVDINKTSMNFEAEIKKVLHPNVMLTSNVFAPVDPSFLFTEKDSLGKMLKEFYKGGPNG